MIKVVIEVRDGATRFSAVVQAGSILQAASLAAITYPNADFRVKFPIDPEAFFVKNQTARAEIASFERSENLAA